MWIEEKNKMIWIFAAALLALMYSGYLIFYINRQPPGSQKMIDIANGVKEGAI